MPDARRDAPTPLSPTDIQRLLQSIFTEAPADLAIEAFAVTAASLYGWCDPDDVDAALALISMPIAPPRPPRRQAAAVN